MISMALSMPVVAQGLIEAVSRHAQSSLHRYAVAFTLHYLCGRNPLAQTTFDQIPAKELGPDWATEYSPALMVLAGMINENQQDYETACSINGLYSDQYQELELTDDLISGLQLLNHQASARLAFENGTWFRLTGYELEFERYVEDLISRLSLNAHNRTWLSTVNLGAIVN